jgi:hypothetical protein
MKLINDWTPETRSLLKTLQAHGLTIVKVDNGEDETTFAGASLADFIAEATACDEARLYVKTPSGETRSLYLVFGNSPGLTPSSRLRWTSITTSGTGASSPSASRRTDKIVNSNPPRKWVDFFIPFYIDTL